MLRVDIYRKASKDFEANGFHCYILNITLFFGISHGSQKKSMMSGKVRTFSKQNVICRR